MTVKILQARAQTSSWQKRIDIYFDEQTGLITKIEDAKKSKNEVDFFYGDECLLFAGMGDIHIHAREDVSGKNIYKEDFHSTCCAAINGGVAHVADMPNNPIAPVDDKTYLEKLKLTEKHPLPILLYAGIGPQTRPVSFMVPYKVYMGPSIGELYFKNNEQLEEVLKHYRNEWVSFHCEDPEILESHKGEDTHEKRRPLIAEVMATDVALSLIEKYNLKAKLCHYSAGEGLAKIRAARLKGLHVTTEVTPQHLFYTVEKIKKSFPKEEQTFFQMNPPIREQADADALLKAICDGEIDFLATDHAPHSIEEKQKGTSGLPGLDTFGPFVTWLLITQKIDPQIIASICSEKPGAFLSTFLPELQSRSVAFKRWGKGIGQLKAGFNASFSVLNLEKPITITRENLKTKAAWSPFLGVTFPGSVEALFVSGKKM